MVRLISQIGMPVENCKGSVPSLFQFEEGEGFLELDSGVLKKSFCRGSFLADGAVKGAGLQALGFPMIPRPTLSLYLRVGRVGTERLAFFFRPPYSLLNIIKLYQNSINSI